MRAKVPQMKLDEVFEKKSEVAAAADDSDADAARARWPTVLLVGGR